ncbi:NodB homology domain-containing protein [Candidatus Hydrogenisulfobacillus filiaventi]|uniref:NodB homology domain-containing protein n=1 Tax=Candidatus Hydrogenisulfobacillus filiaventi TaxID=2707344 RepID=A0A6F8ZGA0_9FIRM|nr:polysaccharide deacetylase family protein [Bacillota bacterium]CAB1128778.1 NodB homology domain-containing protein [Candidatus Hydrogenisulfobacillus filiaventi]
MFTPIARRLAGWASAVLLAAAAAAPARAASALVVSRVPTTDKVAALSFDDGPTAKWTPRVLQVLTAHHVPATFFIIGSQANRYPELIREEVKAGMEIGSHGATHLTLRARSAEQVQREVEENAAILTALGAPKPRLYRLPGGRSDAVSLDVLGRMGYTVIGWTIDTRDWQRRYSADHMARQVLREIRPGSIIIFHDGTNSSTATVQAVEQIIPRLQAEGYRLVTVGELVRRLEGLSRPRI